MIDLILVFKPSTRPFDTPSSIAAMMPALWVRIVFDNRTKVTIRDREARSNVTRYIDLADFLVIAEAVLGIDAKVLARSEKIDLAESALYSPSAWFDGIEFYQGFALKATVLVMYLVKNHPLPDANKRSSYVCLREFVHRNKYFWKTGAND